MKLMIVATLAVAALAGSGLQAQACNPMLSKSFGKPANPTQLPAFMLAKNNPSRAAAGTPVSIAGLWHDVHTASDGTLFLEGFDTWNATGPTNGTENELGNLPPATGALCVGAWELTGSVVELKTHVAWLYDLLGNYDGVLKMTERNKVAPDGNTYFGTFDAKFFDTTGALFSEVTGTTTADRLVQ